MSVDNRVRAGERAWETWPQQGVPVTLEQWRRPQSPAVATSLARSAGVVAGGYVASRVLGLVREVLLARQFGTSGEYDAYVTAFRIPDLLFLVIMAGAFGSAFIPVFAGLLAKQDERAAWKLASTILTGAGLLLTVFGVLTFVVAEPLVSVVIAPGLAPEFQATAVQLMRLLLLQPLFLGLGIAAKGILEAENRFTLPAFAPVLYNLAIIAGLVFLAPTLGITAVAIGAVAGAFCHVAVQVPGLVRAGMRFRPSLDLETTGLAEVTRLLGPRIIGQAAFQINFIAVNWFASRTGEGSVAALNSAWQLLMLPWGIVALSISTVIFPTMSRQFEQGDLLELRTTFMRAVRPLLFLTIPAGIALFFYRTPIIQAIFQHGAFTAASTALVAGPLAMFALGLLGYALAEVLTRVFYAMHDTRTPVVIGIATIVMNVVLSAVLVGRLGHTALALSLSATTTVEAIILFMLLRRRIGVALRGERVWLGKVALAAGVTGLVAWLTAQPVTAATMPDTAHRLAQVLLLGYALIVVTVSYFVVAFLVRLPEILMVWQRLPGRVQRLPGMAWVGRQLLPDGTRSWRKPR